MAEFSMWGPEQSGARLAEKDTFARALDSMSLMKTQAELQQMPIDAEMKQSHARLYRAEAGLKENELLTEQAVAQAMQKLSSGQGTPAGEMDPTDLLESAGRLRLNAGDTKGGAKLLEGAALVRARDAAAQARGAQQERATWLTQRDRHKFAVDLIGSVTDQNSLNRALFEAQGAGLDVSGVPTNYEEAKPAVEHAKQQAMNAYQRAQLKLSELDKESSDRNRRSAIAQRELRAPLIRAQTAATEAMAANRERQGISRPTDKEQADAASSILQIIPGLDKDQAAAASLDVASEAKRLLRQNPGLTWSQAVAQAVDANAFQETPGKIPFTTKRAYNAQGKTPSAPITSIPEAAKRITGRYYQTPKGPYQWTKQGWVASSRSAMLPALTGAGLGVDDEDEDQ